MQTSLLPTSRLRRGVATVAAIAAGAALFAGNAGVAAADGGHTIEIDFSSVGHLTNPGPDGVMHWTLMTEDCTAVTDGAAPEPCDFNASGTLTADGGDGFGVVRVGDRVIRIYETAESTGPTTGIGYGPVQITGAGGAPITGSFTGAFEFAFTDKPGWALDWGTLTVTY